MSASEIPTQPAPDPAPHPAHRRPLRVFFTFFVLFAIAGVLVEKVVGTFWRGPDEARLSRTIVTAALGALISLAWIRLSGYRKPADPPAA